MIYFLIHICHRMCYLSFTPSLLNSSTPFTFVLSPFTSPFAFRLLNSFTPSLLNSFTPINEKNVFLVFLMIDLYHRVMKIEMVKRSANLFVRTIYQLKIQSTWYFKSIIRPVFNVFFNLVFFPVFFSCFLPCFSLILMCKNCRFL